MNRTIMRAGAALALGAAALASLATPAGAVSDPVDIRVEHDLPDPSDGSAGPRVLEVAGVTAGPGPEITIADETENPSSWGGNVLVDIDPDAQTITVEVEDDNCYGSTLVEITTDEIASVTTVSDEIYDVGEDIALTTDVSGGVVTLSWLHGTEDTCPSYREVGSQSVFSYEVVDPTLTVDPSSGLPGDVLEIAGTFCDGDEVTVSVTLDGSEVATEVATVTDGNWSIDLDTTGYALGTYEVDGTCSILDDPIFDYETASFVLSTPTTTMQPTTTAGPVNSGTQTPAAQPTVASPTFTG